MRTGACVHKRVCVDARSAHVGVQVLMAARRARLWPGWPFYDTLHQGIAKCMPPGWVCTFVPAIVGSSSIPEEEWDKAMAALGVPKTRGTALRAEMMRVMLDGQDSMLRGYRAQLAEA